MLRPRIHFEQVPLAVVLKNVEEMQSNENKPPKKQQTLKGKIENGRIQNARSDNGSNQERS